MSRLKFYDREKEEFPLEINIHLEDAMIKKISRKIARHFKIKLGNIRLWGNYNKTGGAAYYSGNIRLPHNCSLHLVCHELAHLYNNQKNLGFGHTKKLMIIIRRMVRYCRKMGYWGLKEGY